MKVISAETMQTIDRLAITGYSIPGAVMMENAGRAVVREIENIFPEPSGKPVVVIAGKGNNGGDGYVIARLLAGERWKTALFVLANRSAITGDAAMNLELLDPASVTFAEEHLPENFSSVISEAALIIDAMLGTGVRNEIQGVFRDAVRLINNSGKKVVAVDIPSGINATTGQIMGEAVKAEITVTFASAKLGHVLYPGASHTGRLVVADIGIPDRIVANSPGCEFLDAATICPHIKTRDRTAHKGNFGHCLVIAGSTGKTGAAALSANSAVRTGSGLVTLSVPASLNHILEIKITEAMTSPLPDNGEGHLLNANFAALKKRMGDKDSLLIGPGLGLHPSTARLVHKIILTATIPVVIDADGLNAIAGNTRMLERKKTGIVVMTPHPGEMARLTGLSVKEIENDRIGTAGEFARRHGVYLILKGARTVIASPAGEAAINGSGNPGMASGGMGDVLAGIAASLLGQGYTPWNACCIAVFLHGYAADLVASEKGESGMNATDVMEKIPYALKQLTETGQRSS